MFNFKLGVDTLLCCATWWWKNTVCSDKPLRQPNISVSINATIISHYAIMSPMTTDEASTEGLTLWECVIEGIDTLPAVQS
jgi:hypothetical protein